MNANTNHKPDLDAALESELVRLARKAQPVNAPSGSARVVILAGGRGRRLEPYTSVLPKPLMPLGNRSILEIVVNQLADAGFTNLTFCVGYLSHLIQAVFENGPGERADIEWVHESEPLGTAGPLRLVERLDETFLVMNGDLLTTLDYAALLDHHRSSGNVLTIAAHSRRTRSDYGVLHLGEGAASRRVLAYEEKPELTFNVSMGVYVMEPAALTAIPDSGAFDFPDLVFALLERNLPVAVDQKHILAIGRVEARQHGAAVPTVRFVNHAHP